MQDPPIAIELPERDTGGFLGRGGESEQDYRKRLSAGLTEGLTGIALRNDIHERQTKEQIAHLKLRLETAERQAAEFRQNSETWTKVFRAYHALGRTDELEKTLNEHNAALKAQERTSERQRQQQAEQVHQQELERKPHQREQELRPSRDRSRDKGSDFEL